MPKVSRLRAQCVKRVARTFKMRAYSFTHRQSHWAIAIRGNALLLTLTTPDQTTDWQDIRRLGNDKDYALFAALTALGQKNSPNYQLLVKGTFKSVIERYKSAILARTGRHVYSTRWWRIALAIARYVRLYRQRVPCVSIAEDVQRGMLMVMLNYAFVGPFYIFVAGIPVDFIYPYHEHCTPERHKSISALLKQSEIIPWAYRFYKKDIVPVLEPPPTLEEIYGIGEEAF